MEKCSLCREGVVIKEERLISRREATITREDMDKALGIVLGALGGKAFKEVMDFYAAPKIGATGNEAAKALIGAALVALPYGFRLSPAVEAGVLGLGSFLLADGAGNIIKNVVTGTPMARVELVPVQAPAPAPAFPSGGRHSLFG
jgi:hypothetical protein